MATERLTGTLKTSPTIPGRCAANRRTATHREGWSLKEVAASHRLCEDATADSRWEEAAGTAGDDTSHRESHGHRTEPAPRQSENDAPRNGNTREIRSWSRRSRQAAVKRRTFSLCACGPD